MHPDPIRPEVSDQAIEWFARCRAGELPETQRARFKAWLAADPEHARAFADIERFWGGLDAPARRAYANSAMHGSKPGSIRRRLRLAPLGLAFAAGLALALWLPPALRFRISDHRTDWGERRELTLPDGTRITLNTHTALSVDFSSALRTVRLAEGEAYFEVARDTARPFVVLADSGEVRVTGTAFNLRDDGDRMTVTVAEGRVRITPSRGQANVEVAAGYRVSSGGSGSPTVGPADPGAGAWRDGLLAFEGQPLAAVVSELNRYSPSVIVIADPRIRSRIVSGVFDLNRPEGIRSAIEKTLHLASVQISPALTLLYQPGR